MLSQTVPVQRRGSSKSFVMGNTSTYGGGVGGGVGGGGAGAGGSVKTAAREEYLRKILQSRHPFPPHYHIFLYMDRCGEASVGEQRGCCCLFVVA